MAYIIHDKTANIQTHMKTNVPLAIRFMLNDIKEISSPITPMLTGDLRRNITIRAGGKRGSIKWGQKYAEYQERGYTSGEVKRYTTAGTQAHFAEESVVKVTRNSEDYFRRAKVGS